MTDQLTVGDEAVYAVGEVAIAIDPATGDIRWKHEHAGHCWCPPTVTDRNSTGGNVYFPVKSEEGGVRIVALERTTGDVSWTDSTRDYSTLSPTTDGDRVYVGVDGGLQALDATTGNPVWQSDLPGGLLAPPTLHDGMLYLSTGGHVVAVKTATGTLAWNTPID